MHDRSVMPGKNPRESRLTLDRRCAGVLMHVTSLPGPHGSGDLGSGARQFVDFLVRARQRWWQTLPVGPIGPGDSPYSSCSAFAGSGLMIDLKSLYQEGLLTRDEAQPLRGFTDNRVRYPLVSRYRAKRRRLAFERFRGQRRWRNALQHFVDQQGRWLHDYTLYQALKHAHDNTSWIHWDRPTRLRNPGALREARDAMRDQIAYEQFVQFTFARQWAALRDYCHDHGVGLIGDIPIFMDHDSCDVWAHRELFHLDQSGRPKLLSGAPPDAFCQSGQLWGHPVYNWRRHEQTGFAWWIDRFRQMTHRFDAVRIDHFVGFHRAWVTPAGAATAEHGRWRRSRGRALFERLRDVLGPIQVIAEDLGFVTPPVAALRDDFGFLGMRLLQHGLGGARYDQPHNYPCRCVAYPGTHDNDTTAGWFHKLPRSSSRQGVVSDIPGRVLAYTGSDGRQIHWDLIRLLYTSPADVVIVPMQDVLGLGSLARMNIPGTPKGNWRWRLSPTLLHHAPADRLCHLAAVSQRLVESNA